MTHLEFLNKNVFRKYPIRMDSAWTTEAGISLPLSLFTSMRLTTKYIRRNIYIKYLVIKNGYVNITLLHRDDPVSNISSPEYCVGCFSGYITEDYQDLEFTSFDGFTSGMLTIGLKEAFSGVTGAHVLSYQNGKIEDSQILCYTPPLVTNLLVKGVRVTGNIALELENLSYALANPDVTMTVTNPSAVASIGDLNSTYNNCGTPVIARINTVSPDTNGNIDIWGIEPVEIHIASDIMTVNTGALGVDDICTKSVHNIPPLNENDTYYTNILTATEPEWKNNWPQYQSSNYA